MYDTRMFSTSISEEEQGQNNTHDNAVKMRPDSKTEEEYFRVMQSWEDEKVQDGRKRDQQVVKDYTLNSCLVARIGWFVASEEQEGLQRLPQRQFQPDLLQRFRIPTKIESKRI